MSKFTVTCISIQDSTCAQLKYHVISIKTYLFLEGPIICYRTHKHHEEKELPKQVWVKVLEKYQSGLGYKIYLKHSAEDL